MVRMAIALAKGGLPLLHRLIILATTIRTPFRAEVKRRTSGSEVHGRVGEIYLLIYLYGNQTDTLHKPELDSLLTL